MDNPHEIGRLLGVPGVESLDRGDLITFRLSNPATGINLKLELRPSRGWVRVHIDLNRKTGARHIGQIELSNLKRWEVDFERAEVRFTDERLVLAISPAGIYRIQSA